MRRRLLAGVALVALVLSACGPDATGPVEVKRPAGPQTTHDPDHLALADLITEQLTCLYSVAGLLPNEASSIGKFNAIKAALDAGDTQGAVDGTANLVKFIELKYSQYANPENTIDCGGSIGSITVHALKDDVIKNLWSYVGLNGTICEVPPGAPKICQTGDETTGFVYFPDDIFSTLTYVALEVNQDPLQFQFVEYRNRVRIVASATSDFSTFALKPLVVVCFDDTQAIPPEVLARLLLGTKHETPPTTTFKFLGPSIGDYPLEVQQQAIDMCGTAQPAPAFSSRTAFGRFGNRLLDMLLPAAVQAQSGGLSFGGVGGSAEQFSNFGPVDPGLNAFGGVGGSAEQFAPGAGAPPSGPSASIYTAATSTVSDTAGAKACLPGSLDPTCTSTSAGGLPSVTITAPGPIPGTPGTPIPNVEVVFQLLDPTIHTPTSDATLCGAATVTVPTNGFGVATLPCLSFGNTVGYKVLQATVNPTTVDLLACIIDGVACTPSSLRNFLVETTAGAPALIKTYMPPSSPDTARTFNYGTGLPEGVAVSPAPQVIVMDQYSNPVGAGVGITWSPLTGSNGAVLDSSNASKTSAGGLAQVTSWTLGAGLNQILAEITGVVATAASFTGSVPTGQSVFACPVGGNKTDIGAISFPKPNGTVRGITIYMSVTGQSDVEKTYNATYTVKKNNAAGAIVGRGAGGVTLPGNNGSPQTITLGLSDVVLTTETAGTGQNAVNTLWVEVAFDNLPPTRKIQVWYNNSITRSNQVPCGNSLVYNPGSTTVFKRGLGINVTN
jgi:hypothetical protein